MIEGLRGFIEGRILRHSSLPTVDLAIRKLSAIEALSASEQANPAMLSSIAIEPNLWPTSAVIDWYIILQRMTAIRDRNTRLTEAEQILRTRLSYQGTTMNFSTERGDRLWWLMISPDENSVRLALSVLEVSELESGYFQGRPRRAGPAEKRTVGHHRRQCLGSAGHGEVFTAV